MFAASTVHCPAKGRNHGVCAIPKVILPTCQAVCGSQGPLCSITFPAHQAFCPHTGHLPLTFYSYSEFILLTRSKQFMDWHKHTPFCPFDLTYYLSKEIFFFIKMLVTYPHRKTLKWVRIDLTILNFLRPCLLEPALWTFVWLPTLKWTLLLASTRCTRNYPTLQGAP